jgi:hypothetical protein
MKSARVIRVLCEQGLVSGLGIRGVLAPGRRALRGRSTDGGQIASGGRQFLRGQFDAPKLSPAAAARVYTMAARPVAAQTGEADEKLRSITDRHG